MGILSRDKFRLNYFNRFVFTINMLVLFVAYTIYLNFVFKPSEIPYFNFISIGFPILFIFLLLFILYWIIFSWRHFLLVTLFSLGAFYPIYLSYPLKNFSEKKELKANLSVMTFNAHGFRADGTSELIDQNLADIILLQEARQKQQKNWSEKSLNQYYKEYYGLLTIYSKYPIIKTNVIEDTGNTGVGLGAYADIDLGYDTIRVINLYMEPMYIEKALVKDVISSDTAEEIEETSKKLETKLVKGMVMHQSQLADVIPFIRKSPHPVILGSDLNSTPLSYEYIELIKYLNDSYILAGEGNGTTFHGFKFPIRIDYLFHSNHFEVVDAKVIRKKFSDHFPVIVNYKLHN